MMVANALILKYRSKVYVAENPALKKGYDNFIKGVLFYGNIPWVIMGIGALAGMTNNGFEYAAPRQMNPIVLIFHASLVILWLLSVWWIYFRGGAEFIERHPGLIQKKSFSGRKNVTAKEIKIFYPIMLLAGVIAMILMWVMDIQIPNF